MKAKYVKLHPDAVKPTKAHPHSDKCYDFVSVESGWLAPLERKLFGTGLAIQLESGYGITFKDKSGVSTNKGLHVLAGEIDNGYRGELKILIVNLDKVKHFVEAGKELCQGKIEKIIDAEWEEWDTLDDTVRGTGGFGSTGD